MNICCITRRHPSGEFMLIKNIILKYYGQERTDSATDVFYRLISWDKIHRINHCLKKVFKKFEKKNC